MEAGKAGDDDNGGESRGGKWVVCGLTAAPRMKA